MKNTDTLKKPLKEMNPKQVIEEALKRAKIEDANLDDHGTLLIGPRENPPSNNTSVQDLQDD